VAAKKKPAKKPSRRKPTPKKASKRTPPDTWKKGFLAALAATGNVTEAARAAKVNRPNAYQARQDDPAFSAAWKDALEEAIDDLEKEARRRAQQGVRRLKFHQGELITIPLVRDGELVIDDKGAFVMTPYVEHDYSDTLLIFLLKAHRPEKFRERYEVEHKGGVRLEIVEEIVDAGDPEDGQAPSGPA
jgi:hypothetical protein